MGTVQTTIADRSVFRRRVVIRMNAGGSLFLDLTAFGFFHHPVKAQAEPVNTMVGIASMKRMLYM